MKNAGKTAPAARLADSARGTRVFFRESFPTQQSQDSHTDHGGRISRSNGLGSPPK
jgi:hypothetical protein